MHYFCFLAFTSFSFVSDAELDAQVFKNAAFLQFFLIVLVVDLLQDSCSFSLHLRLIPFHQGIDKTMVCGVVIVADEPPLY